MPLLSDISRRKKLTHFFRDIPKTARILEIGSGAGWVGEYLKAGGWQGYIGMDLFPPADIVGDIKQWQQTGLQPESMDVIVAFECIEHVDLVQEALDILKPGGLLLLTSPVPSMDWVMKILESIGLNQKRTSPHCNLVDFRKLLLFEMVDYRRIGGLAQWGVLRKPLACR